MTRYAEHDDLSLVELIVRNETEAEEAFSEIYRRYGRKIYRFLFHTLRSPSDADDAFQETFFRVHRSLPAYRKQCSLSTWIYRIASGSAVDHIRSAKRRRQLVQDAAQVTETAFSPDYAAKICEDRELARLHEEIFRLPENLRQACVLRNIEGLSSMDIAGILKISDRAVRKKLEKAEKMLRSALKEVL